MVFDDVYPAGQHLPLLEDKYGCRVAVVPFMDCMPNTSYLVCEDGSHVFVSVDFERYCQVKEVKIKSAGQRSTNSRPCFKRRNKNGKQSYVSLPVAVYGAFVLGELPKYKIYNIDGDPNNCRIDNLRPVGDLAISEGVNEFANIYERYFDTVVAYLIKHYSISFPDAQDFASEAFLVLCLKSRRIDISCPVGLWICLSKEQIFKHFRWRPIKCDIQDALYDIPSTDISDHVAHYQSIIGSLSDRCKIVVRLRASGYTQRECAKMLNCSQSWINKLFKDAKRIILNDEL